MRKYNLNIELDLHNNKSVSKYFTVNDFSIELIKLINKVYHKDFELFDYEKIG